MSYITYAYPDNDRFKKPKHVALLTLNPFAPDFFFQMLAQPVFKV
jgi:hypothetical protein